MVLGFLKKQTAAPAYDGPPLDPQWIRNARGKFYRLIHLDTSNSQIKGLSCVYVIWHSGVKPEWVFVGRTDDLGGTLDEVQESEDVMDYEINGGLYVTWSPVLKEKQNGVIRFLHDTMNPKVENPSVRSIKDGPINVIVPKRRGD